MNHNFCPTLFDQIADYHTYIKIENKKNLKYRFFTILLQSFKNNTILGINACLFVLGHWVFFSVKPQINRKQ